MPWIDYGDYARSQSDWAYSLLRKATKSDRETAEELSLKAKEAMQRVAEHMNKPNEPEAA